MYLYYQNAAACFVHLADIVSSEDPGLAGFRQCRWFKRSWTLQELIAPYQVVFYDQEWKMLGDRHMLASEIHSATGIEQDVFKYNYDLGRFSIAKRMSWAADRQATRIEDMAYSLLGIFDVNLPLLYGEGHKVFTRLQEEIMKQSDDQSLFAWGKAITFSVHQKAQLQPYDQWFGFLARSPTDFKHSAKIVSYKSNHDTIWTMTNRGIQVNFPTLKDNNQTHFLLDCHVDGEFDKRFAVASVLTEGNTYGRLSNGLLLINYEELERAIQMQGIHFLLKTSVKVGVDADRAFGIYIKRNSHFSILRTEPAASWSKQSQLMCFPLVRDSRTDWHVAVVIELRFDHYEHFKWNPKLQYLISIDVFGNSTRCDIAESPYKMEGVKSEDPLVNSKTWKESFAIELLKCAKARLDQKSLPKNENPSSSANLVVSHDGCCYKVTVTVNLKVILGQPMFVADISQPELLSRKPKLKESMKVITSLVRGRKH